MRKYFWFCAKLIAFHAQKQRKSSQKKICRKIVQIQPFRGNLNYSVCCWLVLLLLNPQMSCHHPSGPIDQQDLRRSCRSVLHPPGKATPPKRVCQHDFFRESWQSKNGVYIFLSHHFTQPHFCVVYNIFTWTSFTLKKGLLLTLVTSIEPLHSRRSFLEFPTAGNTAAQ